MFSRTVVIKPQRPQTIVMPCRHYCILCQSPIDFDTYEEMRQAFDQGLRDAGWIKKPQTAADLAGDDAPERRALDKAFRFLAGFPTRDLPSKEQQEIVQLVREIISVLRPVNGDK